MEMVCFWQSAPCSHLAFNSLAWILIGRNRLSCLKVRSRGATAEAPTIKSVRRIWIKDKKRLDQHQELDKFFEDRLNPVLWDIRPYIHPCPYLGNRARPHPSSIKASNRITACLISRIHIIFSTMTSEHSEANISHTLQEENRPAEVSTTHDPTIMVIDPEFLRFTRIYTSMGAQLKYEDLLFSASNDPLAALR
ncbi:hypothetical protein LIER_19970 [Lithospermum erythrorhizon]|uniref:Uncharacterized protein n=1 Tax=Lithospermum erythrorhizon TaxID=34254 RepID=A0AAV3QNE5_LITER